MSPEHRIPASPSSLPPLEPLRMSEADFRLLSGLVKRLTGIHLDGGKKAMLTGRLASRLRRLGLKSFGQYQRLLEGSGGESEIIQLINSVTTNKTDFFREAHHFAFLSDKVLPGLLQKTKPGSSLNLRAWSAGCSSGEEAYSLAITIAEFFRNRPVADFRLLATDLDTTMLNQASQGIYDARQVKPVPADLRTRYFQMQAAGTQRWFVVKPSLRSLITFGRLNLQGGTLPKPNSLDIIFCRNVLIYFAEPEKNEIISKMAKTLKPGGHLFLGHAESLAADRGEFAYAAPTVYRKLAST